MKENDLLGWLVHQKRHSEIPEVTDEMMDKLIESTEYLAVIFCKLLYLYMFTFEFQGNVYKLNKVFITLQTTRTTSRIYERSTS